MEREVWTQLMERIVAEAEQADYTPGSVLAPGGTGPSMSPGSGTEGDSPIGEDYVALGPLAFVINESIDATVNRGADRDLLIQSIVDKGGGSYSLDDVKAVISGEERDPDAALLRAFSDACSIDLEIMLDAAVRGGAMNSRSGTGTPPPGY